MIAPLLVDVSPWQPHPEWTLLERLGPPWHGAIVKVSDGLSLWKLQSWRSAAASWRASSST